jgi:hypothetical protein
MTQFQLPCLQSSAALLKHWRLATTEICNADSPDFNWELGIQTHMARRHLRRAYKKGYQCCVRGMGAVRKDEVM